MAIFGTFFKNLQFWKGRSGFYALKVRVFDLKSKNTPKNMYFGVQKNKNKKYGENQLFLGCRVDKILKTSMRGAGAQQFKKYLKNQLSENEIDKDEIKARIVSNIHRATLNMMLGTLF